MTSQVGKGQVQASIQRNEGGEQTPLGLPLSLPLSLPSVPLPIQCLKNRAEHPPGARRIGKPAAPTERCMGCNEGSFSIVYFNFSTQILKPGKKAEKQPALRSVPESLC